MNKIGDLRVWWPRQMSREDIEYYPVKDVDEAIKRIKELIKRDHKETSITNIAGGLEEYVGDGNWELYIDEKARTIDGIIAEDESEYPKSKQDIYYELVEKRRKCHKCQGLTNPADIEEGIYDSNHIGPWSRWQGNLESKVLVVGQDWGTVKWFVDYRGRESRSKDGEMAYNPTNDNLIKLLHSIGIDIERQPLVDTEGIIFFTNPILCLKSGNLGSKVKKKWYDICGKEFLRPLIEDCIKPEVVIALGKYARDCVLDAFDVSKDNNYRGPMEQSIKESPKGIQIVNFRLYPVFHCGSNSNINRPFDVQLVDWERIKINLD
jgi:uracil-DNA glycosylase